MRIFFAQIALSIAALLAISPGVDAQEAASPATSTASPTEALSPAPKPFKPSRVLLISGITKDPDQQQAQDRAITQLLETLTSRMEVSSTQITTLVDKSSLVTGASGESTRERIKAAVAKLAKAGPDEQVLFYYAGEANAVGGALRLNIPGADITHEELAEWFRPLKASCFLAVLDVPRAGYFTKPMAGQGRIIIASSRLDQPYRTMFSEYFVSAWADPASDRNADGWVTLTEAFQTAGEQIDEAYRNQDLMKTENALLDDDGDGVPSQAPWRYAERGGDGAVSAMCGLIRP